MGAKEAGSSQWDSSMKFLVEPVLDRRGEPTVRVRKSDLPRRKERFYLLFYRSLTLLGSGNFFAKRLPFFVEDRPSAPEKGPSAHVMCWKRMEEGRDRNGPEKKDEEDCRTAARREGDFAEACGNPTVCATYANKTFGEWRGNAKNANIHVALCCTSSHNRPLWHGSYVNRARSSLFHFLVLASIAPLFLPPRWKSKTLWSWDEDKKNGLVHGLSVGKLFFVEPVRFSINSSHRISVLFLSNRNRLLTGRQVVRVLTSGFGISAFGGKWNCTGNRHFRFRSVNSRLAGTYPCADLSLL